MKVIFNKVNKIVKPRLELTQLGPQISEWIGDKGDSHLLLTLLEKELQLCLPFWEDSHTKDFKLDRCGTIF